MSVELVLIMSKLLLGDRKSDMVDIVVLLVSVANYSCKEKNAN